MSGYATCFYCGRTIAPAERPYQRVIGWERMAGVRASGKHGGSDITLREQLDEFACTGCISLLREGIPAGQQRLA